MWGLGGLIVMKQTTNSSIEHKTSNVFVKSDHGYDLVFENCEQCEPDITDNYWSD